MINDNRRQERRKRDIKIFGTLLGILVSLLLLYTVLAVREERLSLDFTWPWQRVSIAEEAKYRVGDQVTLTAGEGADKIGIISALDDEKNSDDVITYTIKLSQEEYLMTVPEDILDIHETHYKIGDTVEILDGTNNSKKIDGIHFENGEHLYTLLDETTGMRSDFLESAIVTIIDVPLRSDYSAAENNRLIQEAIEASKNHHYSVLNFPEGSFAIGSDNEKEDYILLASNLEMRGNRTTFIVNGASRWLGLATGPDTVDGVSNVLMYGFTFEASDLVKGSQFVLMLNHGNNWKIYNNTFTMVHATGSHVFDLGGVTNFELTNNRFIGYAPELTGVSEIGDREPHDFYSEAIQLDASSTAAWDGNTIRSIDPNFDINNQIKHLSSYVSITHNEFLPYYDEEGQLVAYSATVGQHSTEVGPGVRIQNNRLVSQLVERYDIGDYEKYWYFTPVHAVSHSDIVLEPNSIE